MLTILGSVILPYFGVDTQVHSSGTVQISVECAGPQQHNGPSPVFIRCTFPEI